MRNMLRIIILSLLLLGTLSVGSLLASHRYQTVETDSVERAIAQLKAQIRGKPSNSDLRTRLGYLYLRIQNWDNARTAFELSIELNPEDAETYNGLGESFHGKGASALLPFEAIKRLFKIDNYSRAERQYKKALEIDPDYLLPRYNLGRNYLAKGGNPNYTEAVSAYQRVLEKDLVFRDADYMLGIAYQHLRDFVNAELVLRRVVNSGRFIGKSMVKLAEIYLETGRDTEATTAYYEGLIMLKDSTVLEDIFAEVAILLHEDDLTEYEDLPLAQRGRFIRNLWNSKDPTPTTDLNERLIEHFRRIRFARENFPDIIPPYYDDRGKIYVKYGQPDAKYISPQYSQEVRENESWSYERSIRIGLTFDFVKSGPSFREVQDLTDAAPTGAGLEARMAIARRLYFDRADLTDAYGQFALERGTLDQSVMARFQSDRYEAYDKAPVETFDHVRDEAPLDFVYNFAQFRDPQGNSRLELYTGVSNNQLVYEDQDTGRILTTLDYLIVIQDSIYAPIEKRNRQFTLQANSTDEIHNTLFLHQEDFRIPAGTHFLAVLIKNPQGKTAGEYRNRFVTRDFTNSTLIMSDVQMASDIQEVNTAGKFVKNSLKITPYPYTVVRKSRPVFLYFELYNLKFNTEGRTDYTVTHSVEMLEYRKGFLSRVFGGKKQMGISTSYNQTGIVTEVPEYISIDMSSLPVGLARMTINVEDQSSGENTSRDFQFQIIE